VIATLWTCDGEVERWTFSESAVKTNRFRKRNWLVEEFRRKDDSGFLYRPPARFTGNAGAGVHHGGRRTVAADIPGTKQLFIE